jgi:hypothetical protein
MGLLPHLVAVPSHDSNEVTRTGFHYSASDDQHKPPDVTDGCVLSLAYSSSWVAQLYFGARGEGIYARTLQTPDGQPPVWSAYRRIADEHDLANKVDKTIVLPAGTDLNAVVTSGFYKMSGVTNGPAQIAVDYGQLIVSRGGDTILQIASDHFGNMAFRSGNPVEAGGFGEYGPWRRVLGDDDLATLAAPPTWHNLPLQNGVSGSVCFAKVGNIGCINGYIYTTETGNINFASLPVGYRPRHGYGNPRTLICAAQTSVVRLLNFSGSSLWLDPCPTWASANSAGFTLVYFIEE